MTTLMLDTEPTIVDMTLNEEKLIVDLEDGRSLIIPISWYPRLLQAHLLNAKTGSYWATGTPSNGLTWTNILALKAY